MSCIDHGQKGTKDGYGRLGWKGKSIPAHRKMYALHHGIDIADLHGLVVRHTCDNPRCINPAHLEAGTQKDNMRDMQQRGRERKVFGEDCHSAKLTPAQIGEARSLYVKYSKEFGSSALARRFGVSQAAMHKALINKSWKSVDGETQ